MRHKYKVGSGGSGLCGPIVSGGVYVDSWEIVTCPKCLQLRDTHDLNEKQVQELKEKLFPREEKK